MNRPFRKEQIHSTYSDGLSDVFKSMFNSACKKLASESTKKIAKSAIESAAKSATEPIGKKTGKIVANKIFKSSNKEEVPLVPNIEEPKVLANKGHIIEKELKKIYKDDKIDKNNETYNDISKKFNEIL